MSDNTVVFTKEKIEQITVAVDNLYGGINQLDNKALFFIRSVMENGRFEEMYAAIRESEQNTKSVLIAFEEKYPGALREVDIDSVVRNAERKSEDKMSVRAALEKLKREQKSKNQKTEQEGDDR